MIKAMVMSAGVGSRLDPLTRFVPKPLVPIANRPVMDILFEKLISIGVKDVICNTHYLSDKIIERYKKNNFGINFNFIKEETLSGTAGGVKESITSQQADSQSDSVQTVFTVVEQMPQFPGGETALMKYLADNLRYPIRAQENGIQGIVHVRFAVDEEGRIPFAKVMKSVDKDLDAEALRVVKSMPQWIPGMQRGRKVKVLMNLPVVFRLKR